MGHPPLDAERHGGLRAALRRGRWRRRLLYGAAMLALIAVVAGGLGYSQRERVRTEPMVQAIDDWWEELLSPPWNAARMGDGGPASELVLISAAGIDQDDAGNIYVTDRGRGTRGRFVWRIDTASIAHVIAGTGRRGRPTPGDLAVDTALGSPEGVVVGPDGLVYFSDSYGHMVLRIEADGRLTSVAGTGDPGYGGDGGPAGSAQLFYPYDIRFDSTGQLYIADFLNHRVRVVTREGRIETAAGTGESGYDGNGGPATAARLNQPHGIAIDGRDRVLIADSLNNVIRRVEPDGTISTVVGSSARGFDGDGGPAPEASLDSPQSVMVDGLGRILVGDEHNHAVRVVDTDGTIHTLAGVGMPGMAIDGSIAASAPLNDPENLLMLIDGSVLITEGAAGRGRVVRVTPDGRIGMFAGRVEPDDALRPNGRKQMPPHLGSRANLAGGAGDAPTPAGP